MYCITGSCIIVLGPRTLLTTIIGLEGCNVPGSSSNDGNDTTSSHTTENAFHSSYLAMIAVSVELTVCRLGIQRKISVAEKAAVFSDHSEHSSSAPPEGS